MLYDMTPDGPGSEVIAPASRVTHYKADRLTFVKLIACCTCRKVGEKYQPKDAREKRDSVLHDSLLNF
jgi:hypothetical protein